MIELSVGGKSCRVPLKDLKTFAEMEKMSIKELIEALK